MNINHVTLVGRATSTPELRKTPSGQSVTSFSIATNRVWTDKAGAKQEEVEFSNIVMWGRQAEVASQFVTKGSLLAVEGRLKTRAWKDKQGVERKTTDIIAENLQLGPRPDRMPVQERLEKNEEIPSVSDEPPAEEIKSEDLPF